MVQLGAGKVAGGIVLDAFQARDNVVQHAHQNAVVDTVLVNGSHLKGASASQREQ